MILLGAIGFTGSMNDPSSQTCWFTGNAMVHPTIPEGCRLALELLDIATNGQTRWAGCPECGKTWREEEGGWVEVKPA